MRKDLLEGRELRRERLADISLKLFSQYGFSGVTMEQIAEAADYTRVSVYNHFRGKAMIYLWIIQRDTQGLANDVGEKIAAAAPGRAQFDALLDGLADWAERHPSFFYLYFVAREEAERDLTREKRRELESYHFRLLELVRGVFARGIEAGVFRDVEGPTAANLFFVNVVGAILLHRTHAFRATLPELMRASGHYFLRGLGAAEGGYPLAFDAEKSPEVAVPTRRSRSR